MRLQTMLTAAGMLLGTEALAQDAYAPDVAEFGVEAESIVFGPDDALWLYGDGTIEFWVTPDWTEDPGYDPVVISNAGADGVSYMVAMLGDRSGLGLISGDQEEIAPFDFADGQLHHVAIASDSGKTNVYVDGKTAANFEFAFQTLPSAGVWIGSVDGATAPFEGAIAQLRIWDAPISQAVLVQYAQDNPFFGVDGEHPQLDSLLAISAFENRDVLIAELPEAEQENSEGVDNGDEQ